MTGSKSADSVSQKIGAGLPMDGGRQIGLQVLPCPIIQWKGCADS